MEIKYPGGGFGVFGRYYFGSGFTGFMDFQDEIGTPVRHCVSDRCRESAFKGTGGFGLFKRYCFAKIRIRGIFKKTGFFLPS